MHTVELLDEALRVARSLGYGIRQEWLGGVQGGACEVAGKKWLFVDLSLNTIEQLDQVIGSLRHDRGIYSVTCSSELRTFLDIKRAA